MILRNDRLGEEKYDNHGCLMKIVEYNNANDIIVEFQDEYKAHIHTMYSNFIRNSIRNPYRPSVFNVGISGNKYPIKPPELNGKHTQEYKTWRSMIVRSYDKKYSDKHPTYADVYVCDEWLLYDNFYEWLHSQENFDKWFVGEQWNLDKDIIKKGNKVYSPEYCCLVPPNVNRLFTKRDNGRGKYPVGVTLDKKCNKYRADCNNPFAECVYEYGGMYNTPEEAFYKYKNMKEDVIKKVAEIEFAQGNIIKSCYNAMMNYEVEITD